MSSLDTMKRHALWAIPVFIAILFAPFSPEFDLFVAKSTFLHSWLHTQNDQIGFFSTPFFDFVYIYGVLPAQLIFLSALFILILSAWKQTLRPFRSMCLMLSLTFCIGSGLITNSILKEWWGRPRPRQIEDFGGSQTFKPFYQPTFCNLGEPGKSFPSGHATCGFFFFSFYFLGRRLSSSLLRKAGLITGILLGGVISCARIVQGGHFISDIFIAALIMWLTTYFVDYLIYEAPSLANFRKKFYSPNDIASTDLQT